MRSSGDHTAEDYDMAKQCLWCLDGLVVTFEFEGLVDIEVNGDPTTNWINDFYCYPAFHNKDLLKFDIGYYRILCEKIKVIAVERAAK